MHQKLLFDFLVTPAWIWTILSSCFHWRTRKSMELFLQQEQPISNTLLSFTSLPFNSIPVHKFFMPLIIINKRPRYRSKLSKISIAVQGFLTALSMNGSGDPVYFQAQVKNNVRNTIQMLKVCTVYVSWRQFEIIEKWEIKIWQDVVYLQFR